MRILLLDDDVFTAVALSQSLTEAGFDVMGPYLDVDAALLALASRRPDAAVLDIVLRRSAADGEPACSDRLARALDDRGVPIMFLSGFAEGPRMLSRPYLDALFVSKPIGKERFVGSVRKLAELAA